MSALHRLSVRLGEMTWGETAWFFVICLLGTFLGNKTADLIDYLLGF